MGMNDTAWEKIFLEYDILKKIKEKGFFSITASEIKKFGREPRLMTKFDHRVNLPKIFNDNNLSILPISRGEYIISSFKTYQKLDEPIGKIVRYSIPKYIQTLNHEFIVSEAIALNCAKVCGILEDFLEDEKLESTVSGRMGTDTFSFDIATALGIENIKVKNSQIEIDASYEGVNYFALFEAKQDLSDDFLVRQLYYPYRVWRERVTKPIKTVFMIYSNGIFNLYQYKFQEENNYNSAKLVKFKRYSIYNRIKLDEIENIAQSVELLREPSISFPQANSMPRLINLLEILYNSNLSKQDITDTYDFTDRQTNYYTDALRYLGLVDKYKDKDRIRFKLSRLGMKIMKYQLRDRQLAIITEILKHKPFNLVITKWLEFGEVPSCDEIEVIMKKCKLYHIQKDSTYHRRASTIKEWIKWITELCVE